MLKLFIYIFIYLLTYLLIQLLIYLVCCLFCLDAVADIAGDYYGNEDNDDVNVYNKFHIQAYHYMLTDGCFRERIRGASRTQ